MDALIERGCGLDVHEAFVVASLLTGPPKAKPIRTRKTFSTTRAEVLALRVEGRRLHPCRHGEYGDLLETGV